MIPIVSIVGKSDSGKTTLMEKLIPELNRRGYRVATVKHDIHGFGIDKEGKDSWRHRRAGAHSTVISSPKQLALIRSMDHDATLEEIINRFVQDVDIVISEGYKKDKAPKVEIFRKEVHQEPLCTREDHLLALVSNQHFDLGVPCLDLNDVKGLADIIEQSFLKKKTTERVYLKVNGETIPLKPFIDAFIKNSIKGMIFSLKNCSKPKKIEITIR
ncbi:MAG: molybdopterin-guanine dinucleotide biosynthesis protein B [Deltaproteobacteria bacterium]|nr:molybdopterin-guanine dinucleotide biosynthesis protein B [Deltaproteobacteria bacterium]